MACDTQKFTKEEFAELCSKRGYVSFRDGGKRGVLKWCKAHPKEFYTEEDMLEVFRYFEKRKIGGLEPAYSCDEEWIHDPM